jgi:hypothetical protein
MQKATRGDGSDDASCTYPLAITAVLNMALSSLCRAATLPKNSQIGSTLIDREKRYLNAYIVKPRMIGRCTCRCRQLCC